jgi:hypothetical protein
MPLNPTLKNGLEVFTGVHATDSVGLSGSALTSWNGTHYLYNGTSGMYTQNSPFQRILVRMKISDNLSMQMSSPTANATDGVTFKFFNGGKSMKLQAAAVPGFPLPYQGFPTYAEALVPSSFPPGTNVDVLFLVNKTGYKVMLKSAGSSTSNYRKVIELSLRSCTGTFIGSQPYNTLFNVANAYATVTGTGAEVGGIALYSWGIDSDPYLPGPGTKRMYRADFTYTSNPYDVVNDSSFVIDNGTFTKDTGLPIASQVYTTGGSLFVTTAVTGRERLALSANGLYPQAEDDANYYLKIEGMSGGLGFASVAGVALYFNSNISGTLYPVTLESNGAR